MKSKALKIGVITLAMLSVFSCRSQNEPSSRVKIAPADRNVRNVAFLVGSPNDLTGVDRDISEVSSMLKQSDFGYEVVVINRATSSQILAKAEEIGKSLSPNSTVFFYYSGHGSEQGYLITEGLQTLRLSTITKRIGKGFGQGQFKRFIAVMDSCFSGQNINGREQMSMTESHQSLQDVLETSVHNVAEDIQPKSNPNLPFQQALVLAAAQSFEESLDFGPSVGGAFTASWKKMLTRGMQKQNFTVRELLEETRDETRRRTGGSHTPVWKAMPESLLDESLTYAPSHPIPADEIYLALGDGANGSMIFASVPTNFAFASAEICKGEKVACSAGTASKPAPMLGASEIRVTGRSIVRSGEPVTIAHGDILTLVLRDNSGKAIVARSVSVKRK